MPRLRRILALLAAITMVIAGRPTLAAPALCNPCPPDCAMMAQAATTTAPADHSGKSPDHGGKAANPCNQGDICQAPVAAMVMADATQSMAMLSSDDAGLRPPTQVRAPSRPPDRSLRPPISL